MTTFGKTTDGTINYSIPTGQQGANKRTCPSAGTATTISAFLNNGSVSTETIVLAVWADSAGSPGALLAQSLVTLAPALGDRRWDVPLSLPLTTTDYWLGYANASSTTQIHILYDSVAGGFRYRSVAGPTDPFGATNTDIQDLPIWVTFAPTTADQVVSQGLSGHFHM